MSSGELLEWLKALGGIVALLGLAVGLVNYRRSVKTRRAEWLASLHEKFFESDRYKEVRRVLDYHSEPQYSDLANAIAAGAHHPLADELYRYLNFFELLAGLRLLGQISDEEIIGLFDYDLRLIKQHEFVATALRPQGFERLAALLETKHFRLGS
ncbi:MAG TPA: hypothetical protein VGH98_04540 [Gemmatimonadaceae bacterium]|jgi:hypothetical protein